MSLKPYPKYKGSGVEWLGEVPEHWAMVPLKHVADFINGDAFKPTEWSDTGVPIIRIQNLNGGDDFNFFSGDVEERYVVREGDLLFGWSGNRGTSFGPFNWRRTGTYVLNQHIFKVIPKIVDHHSLYWTLVAVTKHVEEQAHGIIGMVHITKGDLGIIQIPIPPADEITKVAAFLDRETAKIDALIAEQEKLIDLLAEKRQATISHAVTKGLNPNAKMKDSGVEWLGEVPEHWEVCNIKHLCSTITDGAHISPDTEGGVYHFVSTKDLTDGGINFEGSLLTSPASYEYLVRTGCQPTEGDILFSKDGTIGRTVLVSENRDFVVASSLIIIRPKMQQLFSKYLNYLCKSSVVAQQVEQFVRGAGLPRLSISNLLKTLGTFPPLAEQVVISDFLDHEITKLDALTAEASRVIDLLKERRTALISAAVTGKIDVRGVVESEKAAA